MPCPEEIPGELLRRLARFGRLHLLDTCQSTNDYAFSLALAAEPAIVVCRTQTQGRGRFRRQWFSDSDSLTFSVLLLPGPEQAGVVPGLTQLAGLAVCRAVEELTGLAPRIRWPNDIVLNDKKLAGILCEQRKAAVVVGVGVNVNQSSFPADIPEPVSLRLATGMPWDRFALLDKILEQFFTLVAEAARGNTQPALEAIKQRSAVLHRRVEVQTLLRRYIGTVIDLDAQGRLVLRTTSGRLVVIGSGQARRLR